MLPIFNILHVFSWIPDNTTRSDKAVSHALTWAAGGHVEPISGDRRGGRWDLGSGSRDLCETPFLLRRKWLRSLKNLLKSVPLFHNAFPNKGEVNILNAVPLKFLYLCDKLCCENVFSYTFWEQMVGESGCPVE